MLLQGLCESGLRVFKRLEPSCWGKARSGCEGFRVFGLLRGYKPL